MSNRKVEPGIYRDFEDKLYFVSGVGRHSECEDEFVVYYPLHESDSKICVRPIEMFVDNVQREEHSGPRFVKVMDWHFANILPGLRFKDVHTFYSGSVFTIKQVLEKNCGLSVEVSDTDGRELSIPISYFLTPTSHCEFV